MDKEEYDEFGEELYKEYLYFEYEEKYENAKKEIERLNNILNEAIEYIEKPISLIYKKDCGKHFKKLLDILKQKKTN